MAGKQMERAPRRRRDAPTVAEAPGGEPITEHESPPNGATSLDPEFRSALIRRAAYALAERRGFVPGRELEDWLAAESEVDRELAAGMPVQRA